MIFERDDGRAGRALSSEVGVPRRFLRRSRQRGGRALANPQLFFRRTLRVRKPPPPASASRRNGRLRLVRLFVIACYSVGVEFNLGSVGAPPLIELLGRKVSRCWKRDRRSGLIAVSAELLEPGAGDVARLRWAAAEQPIGLVIRSCWRGTGDRRRDRSRSGLLDAMLAGPICKIRVRAPERRTLAGVQTCRQFAIAR